MTTDNLGLPLVTAGQNNKEVTINDGILGLDKATQGLLETTVTGSVTMSSDDFKDAFIHRIKGTPASALNLTIPDVKHGFILDNQCGKTVTVKRASGATVAVENGHRKILYNDLTNIISIGGSDVLRFSDLLDVQSYAGQAGKAAVVNATEDGLDFATVAGGGSSGGTNYLAAFAGCVVRRSIYAPGVLPYTIAWDVEDTDSGSFHSSGAQTKITIPSSTNITKAKFTARVQLLGETFDGLKATLELKKNGTTILTEYKKLIYNQDVLEFESQIYNITSGSTQDYEVVLNIVGIDNPANYSIMADGNYFAMQVIETSDASGPPYDLPISCVGVPTADLVLLDMIFTRDVSFPTDFLGSQAYAVVAPTADTTLTVSVIANGSASVGAGTIVFNAGTNTATFDTTTDVQMKAGGRLKITCPHTPDATLADFTVTLAGSRGVA